MVIGDAERIRTIVDNLVSNAIKYSPRSGDDRRRRSASTDGFAVLDVIDEGRGVDPPERERIFESFYQGTPPIEGRVKGSGLGLAIAREYALAQGGRIEVRGRADGKRGAHFRLWLPLAPAMRARPSATPATPLAGDVAAGGATSAQACADALARCGSRSPRLRDAAGCATATSDRSRRRSAHVTPLVDRRRRPAAGAEPPRR